MLKDLWKRKLYQLDQFMRSSTLLNSNNIDKCILILVLGGNDFIKWIIWLWFSQRNPANRQWLNQDLVPLFFAYFAIGFLIFWLLIFICHYGRRNPAIQKYMPFIAVTYLCSVYIFNGYSIGISSPGTIAAYVNIVCLGLVLFTRSIVYSLLIPFTFLLLLLIVLCANHTLPYAPLFSEALNHSVLYDHSFWVTSMMVLYIPIFIASVFILEVLLLQWRNRENLVQEISQKDPLTDLYNRRMINENLAGLVQDEAEYAVVLIDLDHFKSVNDRYGHGVGDHVLRSVAQVLNNNVRGSDLAGRFGGEEFMLILHNKTLSQALVIAERCRSLIEQQKFMLNENVTLQISASFGVAISEPGLAQDQVIKRADRALYQAKRQGRNQVCILDT